MSVGRAGYGAAMTSEGGTEPAGGADPAQIRECGRTVGGRIVVFDMTWDGSLAGGTVAFVVTIDNEDASERVGALPRAHGRRRTPVRRR